MCLRILGRLCYRTQAEECMVIDKAEIVRHWTAVHSVYFAATEHNPVPALPRGSPFKAALTEETVRSLSIVGPA